MIKVLEDYRPNWGIEPDNEPHLLPRSLRGCLALGVGFGETDILGLLSVCAKELINLEFFSLPQGLQHLTNISLPKLKQWTTIHLPAQISEVEAEQLYASNTDLEILQTI